MRRVWLALLLTGCAEPPPPAAPVPARVAVPSWAEGEGAPASKSIVAPSVPEGTLGTDAPPAKSHGKRIDLDLVDADVANVCRLIGELAGVNVVVGDGVTGKVTMRLRHVPWDEALDAILLAKGYRAARVGSVIVVRAK